MPARVGQREELLASSGLKLRIHEVCASWAMVTAVAFCSTGAVAVAGAAAGAAPSLSLLFEQPPSPPRETRPIHITTSRRCIQRLFIQALLDSSLGIGSRTA